MAAKPSIRPFCVDFSVFPSDGSSNNPEAEALSKKQLRLSGEEGERKSREVSRAASKASGRSGSGAPEVHAAHPS